MKPILLTGPGGKPLLVDGDSVIKACWAANPEYPACETRLHLAGPESACVEESVEKVYEKLTEVL